MQDVYSRTVGSVADASILGMGVSSRWNSFFPGYKDPWKRESWTVGKYRALNDRNLYPRIKWRITQVTQVTFKQPWYFSLGSDQVSSHSCVATSFPTYWDASRSRRKFFNNRRKTHNFGKSLKLNRCTRQLPPQGLPKETQQNCMGEAFKSCKIRSSIFHDSLCMLGLTLVLHLDQSHPYYCK